MIHQINTPSGKITIQPAGKPGIEFCLVTLHKFPFPPFDFHLTADHAALLSQAFDLVAEEIGGETALDQAAGIANEAQQTGSGMNVFVWEAIEKCSDNYHSNGGVIVFAATEERARELANQCEGCEIQDTEKPDTVVPLVGGSEGVFVFPNAGCC